jgi:hypothetical protein
MKIYLSKSFYFFSNSICIVFDNMQFFFIILANQKHIFGFGSHVEFPIATKNIKIVDDRQMNINFLPSLNFIGSVVSGKKTEMYKFMDNNAEDNSDDNRSHDPKQH